MGQPSQGGKFGVAMSNKQQRCDEKQVDKKTGWIPGWTAVKTLSRKFSLASRCLSRKVTMPLIEPLHGGKESTNLAS